jgi:hypothetical protein
LRQEASEEAKIACVGEAVGNVRVPYFSTPLGEGYFGYNTENAGHSGKIHESSFAEFGRALLASRQGVSKDILYLQSFKHYDRNTFNAKVRPIPYMNGENVQGPLLWMGGGGQIVDLHFDPYRNFIGMLNGWKRVTLLPPAASRDLYVGVLGNQAVSAVSSRVRLTEWDRAAFPRVIEALKLGCVATLEPGDMLYIPPLWWHHVESSDLNIMINSWENDILPRLFDQALACFVEAMKLFSSVPRALRESYRAIYRRQAFDLEASCELPSEEPRAADLPPLPEKSTFDGIGLNLACSSLVGRALPSYWRESLAEWYDCLVFRTIGDDPFSILSASAIQQLPGELAARRTSSKGAWKEWMK